jgi:hypothetical protein
MKPLISWQGEEGKVGELRARALKEIEQVQSGDLSQAYYMRFLTLAIRAVAGWSIPIDDPQRPFSSALSRVFQKSCAMAWPRLVSP